MAAPGALTAGQARLRAIVSDYPQDGDLWELRDKLGGDPVILADPRTGQLLSAAGANATYARFQTVRWAHSAQLADRWVLDDVDCHAYGRPDQVEHLPAALGGRKAHRTMRFLLDQAVGQQPHLEHVGLDVLTGSRMSCHAPAQHRALAAFLWGGPLIAEGPRIRVIADEPDEDLRRACAIVDRYALHVDGFGVPYGEAADDVRRTYLFELAERLTATPLTHRHGRLEDLEVALAEQQQPHPAKRSWWRHSA